MQNLSFVSPVSFLCGSEIMSVFEINIRLNIRIHNVSILARKQILENCPNRVDCAENGYIIKILVAKLDGTLFCGEKNLKHNIVLEQGTPHYLASQISLHVMFFSFSSCCFFSFASLFNCYLTFWTPFSICYFLLWYSDSHTNF